MVDLEHYVEKFINTAVWYLKRERFAWGKARFIEAVYWVGLKLYKQLTHYIAFFVIEQGMDRTKGYWKTLALSNLIREMIWIVIDEYYNVDRDYRRLSPSKIADRVRKNLGFYLDYIRNNDLWWLFHHITA